MYINYHNYSNFTKNLTTVSNDTINPSKDSDTNNSTPIPEVKMVKESASISQVMSDIVSNEDNYDLLVRCDDISSLVYWNKNNKRVSIVPLEDNDDFDTLSSKTDKYINLSDYTMDDLESLKDEFLSGDISKKLSIVSNILKNSDTNIKESDLIGMYLSYASN
ncbi:hypothetical protein [Romboutsia sp. 1001713B170207_170306_H8]|uniref:hypothetical protein n=1 Tax=Romboutsia sp. 1001713B170207_170306_H8 TaxID=2787112 RepID=UPI0011CB6E66|nr:hypothetical protein [Romboutsia sp. 1001713B170207_170306_H8]